MDAKTLDEITKVDITDYTTAPYQMTHLPDSKVKAKALSDILRSVKINNTMKVSDTPAVDYLTNIRSGKMSGVGRALQGAEHSAKDTVHNLAQENIVAALSNPEGYAAGVAGATAGRAIGGAIGGAAAGTVGLPVVGTFIGGIAGAVGGGVGAAKLADYLDKNAKDINFFSEENQKKYLGFLNNLKEKDKISDELYTKAKEEYLSAAESANKDSEFNKTKNELIDILDGREYPDNRIAQSVLSWASNSIRDRAMLREFQKQNNGGDVNDPYYKAGNIIGALADIVGASYISRAVLSQPRFKIVKDKNGKSTVQLTSPYPRKDIASKTEDMAKTLIFLQEVGGYAEQDMLEYIEKTGDKDLLYYHPTNMQAAMGVAYGKIASVTEFALGGIEAIAAGAFKKIGLKWSAGKAFLKTAAGEGGEEGLQELEEFLARKIDDTSDKTWGEALKDALVASLWGATIGGTIGVGVHSINRNVLINGIMKFNEGQKKKLTRAEATQIADTMIDTAADALDANGIKLRDNLRKKVSFMLKNTEIDNKEDTIDAITDLEYALIAMDATDRGIKIADHELFQGEMTSIGWFREGIPEAQRNEIQKVIDNITDLQTQLETLNKAKEKDWAKIEEIENKLASAEKFIATKISDIGSEIEMLGERYTRSQQESFKKKLRRDNKVKIDKVASTLREKGLEVSIKQSKNKTEPYSSEDTSSYIEVTSPLGKHVFRLSYETNGARRHHKTVDTSYYAELDIDTIVNDILDRIKKPVQLKEELRYVGKPEVNQYQPLFGPKTTVFKATKNGKKADFKFGAYIPGYRFILRANQMNAAGLSKMLAHDWMETNFARYREGKMSKDFMRAWGALEKALGIPENATSVPRKASEAFARAYEGWIVQNEDWTKFINVEDKDKADIEKLMKDYQGELRDIYNDISNPYFINTWGKLGELKPELKAWFDRVVNITDLDVMVERGEMTEEQAATEKLNRAIDTVIETTKDEETKQSLKEFKTLNDTKRYEVEGGNTNSIQRRLSNLAKDIDENNMITKGNKYDTRRDMLQVAEAADNFVKTRRDEALAIINGEMAETEGLFKEDLYTALERLAVETGDLDLIDELKSSEVANTLAKELGQRVAGFRNFKPSTDLDVVSAVKSLDNKFGEVLKNKKAKQKFESALAVLDESIKKQDKAADKELDSFLKDLECK